MTRARREASSRPLSLVSQTFELGQSVVTLLGLGALLAAFSPIALARADRRGDPAVRRRAQVLGRRVPAVALAHARRPASRSTSRPCSLARTTPRRSSCSASGRASSRRYKRDLREAVRRRPRAHDPARGVGAGPRHDRHARVLRHVPVDRAVDDRRRDHDRRDDDVHRRVQAGAVRDVDRARRRRRHVRGQPLPVEPLRVPRDADHDARPATATDRHQARRRRPVRGGLVQLPRLARAGARAASTSTSRPAASSRSSARTARARPR